MFTQTDYDKLKQIMEESQEKKELLTRLLSHQQMEISAISHEIRNPLTLIHSTLQLIEAQHPEVLSYTHWKPLRQDVEYMNQLIDELSAYNNGGRLSLGLLHSEDFLKSVVLSFAASLTETSIEFTSKVESGLPDLSADATKLRQVLLNLLRNAKDAVTDSSFPDGRTAAISFHAHAKGQQLFITVTDNGCGIPSERIASIFEPFVTYKKNGTGLGLAIADRIIRAHGGSLTVSSEPGNRTTFTLSLPVQ